MAIETSPVDERGNLPSASAMERIHYCAGSPGLIAKIPPSELPKTTAIAESGTKIHDAMLTGDTDDLDMTETEIAERLNELEKKAYGKWLVDFLDARTSEAIKRYAEERYWIVNDKLEKVASAKLDVCYISGSYALALDFKTGFLAATAAARNYQLRVQAVAVMHEFGVSHVRVCIAQSRLGDIITAADYTQEDLNRSEAQLMQDLWAAEQPDAAKNPGHWCKYCPGKAHCIEQAVYAMVPPVIGTFGTLSPEALAFVERRRRTAEDFYEKVNERMKALPVEQLEAIGFGLKDGRKMPQLSGTLALSNFLTQCDLLTPLDFLKSCKPTLGDIEEIVVPKLAFKLTQEWGTKVSQKDAKLELRRMLQAGGIVDYESKQASPSLVDLKK